MTTTVNVNDKVIYVPSSNAEPQVTVVTRLTAAGYVGIAEHPKAFRPHQYGERCFIQGSTWGEKARLYPFTDETLDKLTKQAKACRDAENEKQEERKRVHAERERVNKEQAAQIRDVCANTLPIMSQETMLDGSRLYQLDAPLNPEKNSGQQRNRVFDRLVVHVFDDRDFNYETSTEEPCVRANMTYFTALRRLTMRGSYKATTDQEILWDTLQDRYFDWS